MNHEYLQIDSDPIGQGQERICYVHPHDPTKLVKLLKGPSDKQTRRELALYRRLQRKETDYRQLPRLYGLVRTNLGRGFITDLIRDYATTHSTLRSKRPPERSGNRPRPSHD